MTKVLTALALAASMGLAIPSAARAQTSPWWSGDPEVILGYGCTAIQLEPYDSRFNCPWWASHVHEAIDIDLAYGTPIYAGWPGTVTEVGGREAHDYGPHYVKVWLDEGHDLVLGHLSQATVVPGQRVETGTLVGYVGDLGVSDIPNLDFGARPHGGSPYQSIDPSPFLAFLDRSAASQSYAGGDTHGGVQVLARSAANRSVWSLDLAGGWTAIPGGPNRGFANQPVVGDDGRGRLVAFALGVDGYLWTATQMESLDATKSWHAWLPLGRSGNAVALAGSPAVGLDPSGGLHVFAQAVDGTLWEAHQDRAGGRWAWSDTPLGRQAAGDPAVARDSTGNLEILVPTVNGHVLVARQAPASGSWTAWHSLGAPAGSAAGFSGRTALLRDAAGLLEAFVVTGDGSVFESIQLSAGGVAWAPWKAIASRSDGGVAAVLRPDGRVQVFELNTSGLLLTSLREGAGWARWTTLGHGLSGGMVVALAPGGLPLVISKHGAGAFVVRSGDVQDFDLHARGSIEADLAKTQAEAWSALPGLPRRGNLGPAEVTF